MIDWSLLYLDSVSFFGFRNYKLSWFSSYLGSQPVSQSAQTARTKYHRLGGLNNRHVFLTVQEAEQSKTEVLADLILCGVPLPGLQTAISLFAHAAFPWCSVWRESLLFLYGHQSHQEGPTLTASCKPRCFPKAPTPTTIPTCWELGCQHTNLDGTQTLIS